MKSVPIACILTSIAMGAFGQIWIKKGLNSLANLDFSGSLVGAYLRIFLSPYVFAGLTIYGLGVFFWVYGLSKVNLSFAFPFVSLSYVLVFLLSWWMLGEQIPTIRWVGLATICVGVLIVSAS